MIPSEIQPPIPTENDKFRIFFRNSSRDWFRTFSMNSSRSFELISFRKPSRIFSGIPPAVPSEILRGISSEILLRISTFISSRIYSMDSFGNSFQDSSDSFSTDSFIFFPGLPSKILPRIHPEIPPAAYSVILPEIPEFLQNILQGLPPRLQKLPQKYWNLYRNSFGNVVSAFYVYRGLSICFSRYSFLKYLRKSSRNIITEFLQGFL